MKEKIVSKWKDSKQLHKDIRSKYKAIYTKIFKEVQKLEKRNYSLEIKEDKGKNIDIILQINGETISFKDRYLPKGYRFIFGDIFITRSSSYSDIERKIIQVEDIDKDYTVTLEKNALNKKYFLLRLLHELGHANDLEINKELRKISSQRNIALLQGFVKKFIISIVYKTSRFIKRDDILPDWYLKQIIQIKSISERNAWAWALKEAKKLEKMGIDILNDGYKDFIEDSLLTYNLSNINDRLLFGLDIREEDLNLFIK